jgi:hypothetical protein
MMPTWSSLSFPPSLLISLSLPCHCVGAVGRGSDNDLGDGGGRALAEVLGRLTVLLSLDLRCVLV